MNQMHRSVRLFLLGLFSAFLALFSIPTIGYGAYLFWCWLRIHTSGVYYADYWYASTALVFLGIGFLGFWATLYGVWRQSFKGFLLAIPIVTGLVAMVMIPDLLPNGFSSVADSNYLSDVNSFFRVWYEEHHRFPANEAEFREALRTGPVAWQNRAEPAPTSRYKQGGHSLAIRNRGCGQR